jgi:hypothetical protein
MRHGGLRGQLCNLGDNHRAVHQCVLRKLRGVRRSCERSRQSTKKLSSFVSALFDACAHRDSATHRGLLRKAIARWHREVALLSIRVVMELVAF